MSQDLDRVNPGPLDVSYTDDERVVRQAATEDYSTHVMPLTWRSGRLSLTMAWWAMMSAVFYLVTAAVIALAVGTVNALIGMVLAVLAFSAVNYVFSRYAARTGLTVALLSRRLFGHAGAALASLLFAATAIYYAVFEGSVVAVALHRYFGAPALEIWYLVVVVYSIPLVIGGVRRWLDKLNGILLPFYVAGLVAAVVLAARSDGASSDWLTRTPQTAPDLAGPGWLFAFVTYLGAAILMMFTIDFARFGRKQDETFHGVVTFGPVFYVGAFLVNGLAGIFLVDNIVTDGPLSESSVVTGIVDLMGLFGVLFILVTQTRINTANYYLASTNLDAFFSRVFKISFPRVGWLLVAGVLSYLFMLTDVLSYLLAALAWQAVFIIAWVGIALTHIFISRGDKNGLPEFRPGRVKALAPGLAAWFLAAGCGIALLTLGGSFGAMWSSLITLVLSVVLYLAASKLPGRWLLDRPGDPRDEVPDIWEARVKCHRCEHSYTATEMDRDPSAPGHPAICAACGITSADFLRAARVEAGVVRQASAEKAATRSPVEP